MPLQEVVTDLTMMSVIDLGHISTKFSTEISKEGEDNIIQK